MYDGLPIAVRNHHQPGSGHLYLVDPGHALMDLVAEVVAEDPSSAVESVEVPVTILIDLLSFQMGAFIGIDQVNAIDVTPPVAVGDTRTLHVWGGSPFGRFQRGVDMGAVRGQGLGQFPSTLDVGNWRAAAALRWFVKSLSTQFLHDEYIFLWIALEILCELKAFKVEELSKCPRCGHETPECQSCGLPTRQKRQGQSMRGFIEQFGIAETHASAMWRTRQMMHGQARFEPGAAEELARLGQLLRAVVAAALKEQLGLVAEDPPLISTTGLSIHPSLSVGGTTPITEDHLRPLLDGDPEAD
jgi:hypothetical protein